MHYCTYIIVPKEIEEHVIEEYVDSALEPYDESIEVAPYQRQCECSLVDGRASESCSDCSGTGIRWTRYNTASKWDWWQIGGRWNGFIQGISMGGAEEPSLRGNMTQATELLDLHELDFSVQAVPDALIDEQGRWHDQSGHPFCVEELSDDEWTEEVRRILKENQEARVVCCDLHI